MCVIHLNVLAWFWSFHVVLLDLACNQNLFRFILTTICFKQVVLFVFLIRCLPTLFDWSIKGRVLWRFIRESTGYIWAKCGCMMLFWCSHVCLSHSHRQLLLHCVHAFLMSPNYGFLPSPLFDYIFKKGWSTCNIWWEEAPTTLLLHHISFQYWSKIRNKFKEMVLSRV